MKYIFYSVALIIASFILALIYPDDEHTRLCALMYKQYSQEIVNNFQHEIPLTAIDESCK